MVTARSFQPAGTGLHARPEPCFKMDQEIFSVRDIAIPIRSLDCGIEFSKFLGNVVRLFFEAINFHDRLPLDFAVAVVVVQLIPATRGCSFKNRMLFRDTIAFREGFHHGFAVRKLNCNIRQVDFADELLVFLQNSKGIDQKLLRILAWFLPFLHFAVSVDAFSEGRNLFVHVRSKDERFG